MSVLAYCSVMTIHQRLRRLGMLLMSFTASAEIMAACIDAPHTGFARDLAAAHASNELATLDERYPDLGPFQVFIEHSVGEEPDGSTVFGARVQSFKNLAELLASRRNGEFPTAKSRPLRQCANGVCSYDFSTGILHNSLYLKELRYNDDVRCLEVETVWFLDGD